MKLIVDSGSYEAPTLFALLLEVLKHRAMHFLCGEGWVD